MPRTGIPVVDGLIVAAAVLTALGIIWAKALRPIIHAAKRTEETLPVVLAIARDFEKNGGSSLKDSIDSLSESARDLHDYTHGFKHEFTERLVIISGKADLLEQKVDRLAERVAANTPELASVKEDVGLLKADVAQIQAELAVVKIIVDRRSEPR